MSDAAWKSANYNNSITVDQSQIDSLNSRKTKQGNFDYYKQNGANAMEVESLNRFYGKDAVTAAGIGVKSNLPDADRPNIRENRVLPDADRPNVRENRIPTTPKPILPGWHTIDPFDDNKPPKSSTPTPPANPGGRFPTPFGPPTAPPDRAQNPDRVVPANPSARYPTPFGPKPTPAPSTPAPNANARENRVPTMKA